MVGRPFGPGNPGKPFAKGTGGRPRGARNKSTLFAEALRKNDVSAEALVRRVIRSANRGNVRALKICFDRLVPPRRDYPVEVDLPPIETAQDAVKATGKVIQMVGAGEITPSEGEKLVNLIEAQRRALAAAQPRSASSDSCEGSSPARKSVSGIG